MISEYLREFEMRRVFASGDPFYVSNSMLPPDCLLKRYPDGRNEVVSFDCNGREVFVADLDDVLWDVEGAS